MNRTADTNVDITAKMERLKSDVTKYKKFRKIALIVFFSAFAFAALIPFLANLLIAVGVDPHDFSMFGVLFSMSSTVAFQVLPELGIGALIVTSILAAKTESEYKKLYKDAFVEPLIRQIFPNARFYLTDREEELDADDEKAKARIHKRCEDRLNSFLKMGLVNKDDNMRATNILTFYNNENKFEHFSLKCYHTSTDSDGHSQTVVTYEGTEIWFDYETGVPGTMRILCSTVKESVWRHEASFVKKECSLTPEKIETGDVDFDENFDVYATNQHLGFYVLNAYVVQKLKNLRHKYGAYIMMVTSNKVFISFRGMDKFIVFPEVEDYEESHTVNRIKNEVEDLIKVLNDIAHSISKHAHKENIVQDS